jgi:hypothetical protein
MYCNFQYTGNTFNNKKVYKCQDCGITLGLDDPATKVLCFRQQKNVTEATFKQLTNENMDNIDVPANTSLAHIAQNELLKKSKQKELEDNEENMCTPVEIESRMQICSSCEHYQDNSCLLCGCKIVRESNYQNKLAHRNASCPINKWGPISIESN